MSCDSVGPFSDGELSPEDAAAFRTHLARCAACQDELWTATVLAVLIPAAAPAQ